MCIFFWPCQSPVIRGEDNDERKYYCTSTWLVLWGSNYKVLCPLWLINEQKIWLKSGTVFLIPPKAQYIRRQFDLCKKLNFKSSRQANLFEIYILIISPNWNEGSSYSDMKHLSSLLNRSIKIRKSQIVIFTRNISSNLCSLCIYCATLK